MARPAEMGIAAQPADTGHWSDDGMREQRDEGYPPVTTRLLRLYEIALSRKLRTHRSLLTLLDQQLGQDIQEWERELGSYMDRGEYSNVFFSSFFASSFALFEFEVVQLCEFARRSIRFPFSVKDFGARDYMGNAKTYLQKLGVFLCVQLSGRESPSIEHSGTRSCTREEC